MKKSKTNARGENIYRMGVHNNSYSHLQKSHELTVGGGKEFNTSTKIAYCHDQKNVVFAFVLNKCLGLKNDCFAEGNRIFQKVNPHRCDKI